MIGASRKNFVSPSRRYILRYKTEYSDTVHLFDLKNLSELYTNNVYGALAYAKDNILVSKDDIISCVPYEVHIEQVREKEQEEEASNHILVSPTRSYVIFTKDPVTNQEDTYLVTLPYQYSNNEFEATRYLHKNRLPKPNVTNCLTFEMYVKQEPGIRPLIGPTNRIVKVTMKSNEPSQDILSTRIELLEDLRASVGKLYDEIELKLEELLKR